MASLERVRLAAEAIRHIVPDFHRIFDGSHPEVKEGLRQLEGEHYQEAEKRLQKVVSEPKIMPAAPARQARVLLALSTAQWKQKKLAEAADTAESACKLLNGMKSKPAAELEECLDLLGQIRLEEEDLDAAAELFQKALEVTKSAPRPDPKALTVRYRRIATKHWRAGEMEEAGAALRSALEFAQKAYGESDSITADAMIDLGQCELARERFEDARQHLEKGLQIHRQTCGADSEEVARDYQALALAAQAAGDLASAVEFYEKALRLRERQLGGNAADFAVLLMNLADVHVSEGQSSKGVELLQQAVGKLEAARDERVASALNHLALAYAQCGRVDDALVSLRKARQLLDKAPDENNDALRANNALLQELTGYLPMPPEMLYPGSGRGMPEAYTARLGSTQEGLNVNQQFNQQWTSGPNDVAGAGTGAPNYPAHYQPHYPPGYAPVSFSPAYPPPQQPPVIYGAPSAPPALVPAPAHGIVPLPAPAPSAPSHDVPPAGVVPVPVGYFPYYPPPPPAPPTRADSGVQLSFVRPDGTPLERTPNQTTLHLTVMVPEGGIPQKAVAIAKDALPAKPDRPEKIQQTGLSGWEDLAFDLLKIA